MEVFLSILLDKVLHNRNFYYLCKNIDTMEENMFKLVLTEEAKSFIESLPEAASYKIYYK